MATKSDPLKPIKVGNIEVRDSKWMNVLKGPQVGILKCKDLITHEWKYYIGVGDYNHLYPNAEPDEERDTINVVQWGQKFDPESLIKFLQKGLPPENNSKNNKEKKQ